MAVICTLLASGGFVAAGYSDVSTADAAAALSVQNVLRVSDSSSTALNFPTGNDLENFDPVAAGAVGVRMSFANILIQAQKPTPKRVFDLTSPNENTPQLSQGVNAMRANVPEISMDQMSQVRRDILTAAYMGLGHHYVWGGTSFSTGWDCSGFVQWAYAQAGIGLPRTEQWMPMVETENPQPGDLVVQNPDGPNHWSHIGIYIGNGQMISALNPSVGTILHTPGAVSSSSTYFTMPAFAAADEKAAQEAKDATAAEVAAAAKAKESASSSSSPSAKPPAKPSTSKPGTTKPITTKPAGSAPATTKPPTTAPSTNAPSTTTPTGKPETTKPAPPSPTTVPVTKPATTAPETTPPATKPPTTQPTTTAPPAPTSSPPATAPHATSEPARPATTPAPIPEATASPTTKAVESPSATAAPSTSLDAAGEAGETADPAKSSLTATPKESAPASPTTAVPSP